MTGSATIGATPISSAATRRRVLALPVPELAMLVRFALLQELHGEATDPAPVHQAMNLAAVAYVTARRIEGLECLWPFLTQLASEWVRQRQVS